MDNFLIGGLDIAVIIGVFVAVLAIGFILYRKGVSNEDYIIAGRKLKWYAIGFHGAATYVGVATLMGALGLAYATGVSGVLYPASLTISFIVMALIAGRLRGLKPVTTGDVLAQRYNKYARVPAAIAMSMAMIGAAAGQIKAFAAVANSLMGFDVITAIIVLSAISLLYTLLGGMLAVAYTDVLQGIIMIFSVVCVMFPVMLYNVGGLGSLISQLPESFMDPTTAGWTTIASYILVYGILLSFFTTDGQRAIFAAESIGQAKKGSWFAFILLAIFTVVAAIVGMAGSILIPGIENSDQVFPLLAAMLPAGLAGLALGGIVAAGMSTYDTSVITAASIVTVDIVKGLGFSKNSDAKKEKRNNVIASIGIGAIITLLAIYGESILSVVNLGFDMACCVVSAAMLGAMFWPRATSAGCLSSMCVGFAIWIYMYFATPSAFAAWVAVPASIVTLIIVSLLTKPENNEKLKEFYSGFSWVIGKKIWEGGKK